ncbi:uncharacterized protein EI97DRAFT_457005 [Westerdykella ornata]|uniref:F-box domain-containing protein n=1 Tax=Westerdykella ornata TaxID=318751 RepID=A0A6A6JML0_WESOR|nr:uncharacterized protein EI97DRAFT_457005 [Westerdykella ornata]KAF2277757.1 hypothetical protein EI97DRAFT_457005 [Westerdykella ornata]
MASDTDEPTSIRELPVELAARVCKLLPRKGLLSFRLVSRFWAAVTTTLLSTALARDLHHLEVLVTEDGLRTLHGFCQIPEFRREIWTLTLLCLRPPVVANGHTQYADSIYNAIATFLHSGKALEILINIFNSLSAETGLTEVIIRNTNPDYAKSYFLRRRCGGRTLQASLLDCREEWLADLPRRPASKNISMDSFIGLNRSRSVTLEALRTSRFTRKIVRVHIEEEQCYHSCTELLASEQYIQGVDIKLGHEPENTHLVKQCLRDTASVEHLRIRGCRTSLKRPGACFTCHMLFRQLTELSYAHLTTFIISGISIPERSLADFIKQCSPALNRVVICNVSIYRGSWCDTFTELRQKRVEKLSLGNLLDSVDDRNPTTMLLYLVYEINQVAGKDNVLDYIGHIMTQMETVRAMMPMTREFYTVPMPSMPYLISHDIELFDFVSD